MKQSMKAVIQTPTNDLQASLNFYSKLNFTVISEQEPTIISDGGAVIEINPDRFARAGLKLYDASWKGKVEILEKLTPVIKIDKGYLLSDPSGTWIYLVEIAEMPEHNLPDQNTSVLGNLASLSLETISIKSASEIWKILGFSVDMGSEDAGWMSLSNDDGLTISIMKPMNCPHLFFNPSLTYFNGGNNPAIISEIRKLEIAITEEITHFNKEGIVDNIIIRDPGGFGFFIFND